MATKAFIFDMDGVLVDSEGAWIPHQKKFSNSLFGIEIYEKIGSTIGLSIDTIYERAALHGFSLSKQDYYKIYDNQAKIIYAEANPTKDITQLLQYLKNNGYKIGLVSASRSVWIQLMMNKLGIEDYFDFILSLNDRPDLKPKPHPDGYLTALREMGTSSEDTIILEDSNPGIASAKASGAYTIAFKEHLVPNYAQVGADANVRNVKQLLELLENRF